MKFKSLSQFVAALILSLSAATANAAIVGQYTFDANDACDTSGYGNNGTLVNDAAVVSDAGGGLKQASPVLAVDGVNDYMNCGSGSTLNITGPMTVAAWIKPGTQSAYNNYIISKYDYGGNKRCWALCRKNDTNKWFFIISSDGVNANFATGGAESNLTITSNQWVHLTGVFDGTTQKLYVNGVLQTKTTSGVTSIYSAAAAPVTIGTNWNNGNPGTNWFNGRVDEVRIYNHALTQSEISRLLNPGVASNPAPQDNALNVSQNPTLSWTPGDFVQSTQGHLVYLGTNSSDVNNADTSSNLFKGACDGNSYTPDTLLQNTTYYWRVDEVNGAQTWKGGVWNFKTQMGPALVGWWKFEGNTDDSSGYGNNGTSANGAAVVSDSGSGLKLASSVLNVDGVDDYVNCGSGATLNITGPVTIVAWVKPGVQPAGINNYVVSKLDYGTNQRSWALLRTTAYNTWFFVISPDGQPVDINGHLGAESDSQVVTDQWVHLAAVFNGSTQTLYVNGVAQSKTYNVSGIYNSTAPVTFGTNWNSGSPGTNYFNGRIDDVRIYNYALSGAQIAQLLTQGGYSLTASAGTGGSVTTPGAGTFLYNPGTVVDIAAAANTHYYFVNWTGTGVDAGKVAAPGSASTTITMDSNYTVVANFAADQYTITASAGENGDIEPSGAVIKNYGESQLFTASPDAGFTVDKWLVDDYEVQTGGSTYTLSNISADHSVTVTFKMLTNLVAQYTFDMNNADDISGYGNHGILMNGAGIVNDDGEGLKGPSPVLNVDGVNGYVNCGNNSSLNITGPITITAWVKPGSQPAYNNYIVGKFDYGSNQRSWALLRHRLANTWFFVISPDGQVVDIDNLHKGAESDSQVVTDQWVHLAAVFNGSMQTLYVNGVAQSKTYNVSGIYGSTAPLTIGTNWNSGSPGTNYFNGRIDDVRVYNSALTAEQIVLIMRTNFGCAWSPSPANMAKHAEPNVVLGWLSGDYTQDENGHLIYFATDFNDVNDANTSSAAFKGAQSDTVYNPGVLAYNTTYFWRVDEVNDVTIWKSPVWTFSTRVTPFACPAGDLDGDCVVDWNDLYIFAQQWLNPGLPGQGLAGYWKFDGDANDSSGNGKNAAIYGNPTWIAGGIIDGAMKFGGVADFVVAAGIDANGSGGITWSAWFNYDSNGTFVLDQREAAIGYQPMYIGKDDHLGDLQFYSSGTADINYFDTNLQPGRWYHAAMVLENNTVYCYIDGLLAGSKPDTQYDFGSKSLHIGARFSEDPASLFKGMIDDVRIYSYALEENQIRALAHSGPDCANLDGAGGVNLIDFALLTQDWNSPQLEYDNTVSFVGSPTQVGQRWGQLNADIIKSDMQQYFLIPAAEAGISEETLIERSQYFVDICYEIAPHWIEEFDAVANAAGVDPALYTAFVSGVYRNLFLHECISYSVSPDYTLNNAIFFHKNRQNAPKAQAACIIALDVPGVNKFITVTDVSAPSCMMMVNDKGLAGSADYPSTGGSGAPRYRGMMNTYILRYIAERAASCAEALAIVQMFVTNEYYAGGDVGGTHWLFVDKDGNILEVQNDTADVMYAYHNSDKVYFSLYGDSSAADTLINATPPIDFHVFHNVSRDPSIIDSISGMTVEISRTNPDYLTTAWVTMPAKGLAFPLFMGGNQTPLPLVNGQVDLLFRTINGATPQWEMMENDIYSESNTLQSQITTLLEEGRQQDAITLINHWVWLKTKAGMDEAASW